MKRGKVLTIRKMNHAELPSFDDTYEPSQCTISTQAEPGSPEKIDVLAQRAEAGVELWHPNDPSYFGGQHGTWKPVLHSWASDRSDA